MCKIKGKNIIIFLLLISLAIILRSLNLERGFFGDEAVTLLSASANFDDVVPNLIKYDAHPPLTSILLNFWMNISREEIFIRYYFILFGVGVLFLIYITAYEYANCNNSFALFVLFLSAISPMLISMSQFIRNYIDSAFWLLLSNYFLLLIIRRKDRMGIWAGYFISTLLSVYAFYFSVFIIFSQCIYVFIYRFKQKDLLKKWILCQGGVVLLFLPWLPSACNQLSNAHSSRTIDWSKFGFKLAGLDLGVYARNISALFGFDHFFMVYPEGIRAHFGLAPLLFIVVSAFFGLILLILFTLKWLKKEFAQDCASVWFLPCLSILPVLLTWLSAKFTKSLPNARYLLAPHAIFLILVSYCFWQLLCHYRKIGIILLSLFILTYALRVPAAITPLYEGKKVLAYLEKEAIPGDCIIMVDSLPGRAKLRIPAFNIEDYLGKLIPDQGRVSSDADLIKIREIIRPFKRIWFIRCYGNSEIFGLNQRAYDSLVFSGSNQISSSEYNNIKLILMLLKTDE